MKSSGETRFALFDMGFRPFFLLGTIHGMLVMSLWVASRVGWMLPSSRLNPITWHIHEMVFGFACAIIAGFILTASANWCGIRGVHGPVLLGLVGLWMIGRVVWVLEFTVGVSSHWILLDLFWLPTLVALLLPALWKAGKWRNTGLIWIFIGLFVVQILMTASILGWQHPMGVHSSYLAPFLILLLVMIVGGRITPVFTQNRYRDYKVVRSVWLDWCSLLSYYLFLGSLVAFQWGRITGWLALVVGLTHLARMKGWQSFRTFKEPLYWVLHLAYLMIPAGFVLLGLALNWQLLGRSIALHVLTTGGIGFFILAMITRVSNGHTGRPLLAGRWVTLAYICFLGSMFCRTLLTSIWPQGYAQALQWSGLLWILAYGLYLLKFAWILLTPRPDGKPG